MDNLRTKYLKKGDIILCYNRTILSPFILWFLRKVNKDPVRFSHVIMYMGDGAIIQASRHISVNHFFRYLNKKVDKVKIVRNKKLTEEQANKMIKIGFSLLDLPYGVKRFVCIGLNRLFNTNYFTKFLTNKRDQVCSSFVAYMYYKVCGVVFNNVLWENCSPDDIDDEVSNNPDWEVIYKNY